jgi:hypothetical protein
MKRTKNAVLLNVLVVVAAVCYFVIIALGRVSKPEGNVAVIPGSYAAKYADENHLTVAQLADSQQMYFDRRYELFDYSVDSRDRIVLEGYSGQSSDLVIPSSIDGKEVFALGEDFFESLRTVKNIYLSNHTKVIYGEIDKTVIIHCYDDSQFRRDNYDSDWNIETILDSDFIDFTLGDLPFEYNTDGSTYEIVRYNGNDDCIIIPSYINGFPVSKVSKDLFQKSKVVVLPQTVTSITGVESSAWSDPTYTIEFVFSVLAFVLALLMTNIRLYRYSKSNAEYLLTGSQMVAIVLYLIAQTLFGIIVNVTGSFSPYVALIVSVVILVVFLFVAFFGGVGRDHAIAMTDRNASKTSRMDSLKESTKHMADGIKNPELKKLVQRLVDEIRYSDPVSTEATEELEKDIENLIQDLKMYIGENDVENVGKSIGLITTKLNERNVKAKSNK